MTKEMITKASEFDDVIKYIDGSLRKTTEQVLETGFGFHILREICNREKTNFVDIVRERYKINRSTASRWVKIGSQYNSLLKYKNELPASQSTIYSLLTLPDGALDEIVIEGALHPGMTFEEAERLKTLYKAEIRAKVVTKKTIKEENPFQVEIFKENTNIGNTKKEKEINPLPTKPIKELEITDIKEPVLKEYKKLTIQEAFTRLQIDIDTQYKYAKTINKFTEDELHEAYLLLGGEK